MDFETFINEDVLKNYSRSDLLIKLQLDYEEFAGLDAVTLSRWTNGVTKPSLYKQLLIADAADCLNIYIDKCDPQPVTQASVSLFDKYTQQLNNPYHLIRVPKRQEIIRFSVGLGNKERNLYKYVLNIESLEKLAEYLNDIGSQHDAKVFYIGDENDTQSCIYFHEEFGLIFKEKNFLKTTSEMGLDVNNTLLFGISYFQNTEHCEVLFGLIFNHVIKNFFSKEGLFFAIRGRESMEIFEAMEATMIGFDPGAMGTIYVYYIDLKKFYSRPMIFSLVKQYHAAYERYFSDMGNKGVTIEAIKDLIE